MSRIWEIAPLVPFVLLLASVVGPLWFFRRVAADHALLSKTWMSASILGWLSLGLALDAAPAWGLAPLALGLCAAIVAGHAAERRTATLVGVGLLAASVPLGLTLLAFAAAIGSFSATF